MAHMTDLFLIPYSLFPFLFLLFLSFPFILLLPSYPFVLHTSSYTLRPTRFVLLASSYSLHLTRFACADVCIRGFARVHLFDDPLTELPIREFAPDPVHNMPTLTSFHESIVTKNREVKAVLLEQKQKKGVVCGLGNWLCDDVLYAAGIDPGAKTQTMTEIQTGRIHASIVNIVTTAIQCNADQSEFPPHWLFHRRWKKKPTKADLLTIDGKTISVKQVGGRTTYFVRAALQTSSGRKKKLSSSSSSSSSSATRRKKTTRKNNSKKNISAKKEVTCNRSSKRKRITRSGSAKTSTTNNNKKRNKR